MKLTIKRIFLLLQTLLILVMALSCKKSMIDAPINVSDDSSGSKPFIPLPMRKTQVYFGAADYWSQQADPANYSQWNYVRSTADGFYTNFIIMWNNNQSGNPQQNINDMRAAFVHNGCFFETSLETQVNSSANGANNQTTDENSINMLTAGGFNVNNTGLNYGADAERVNTLKTYGYKRTCMALEGAWTFGGDINGNNGSNNAQVRQDILKTDGVELDGPMGFWYDDSGSIKEGTYSAVKYAHSHGLIAALMLAPYDAGQAGYNPTNDFLSTSKQCVMDCEDNNAAPEIWTIWTYAEGAGEPLFPESTTLNGQTAPANTMMGIGYWLLKHLNNLPKIQVPNTGSVGNNTTVSIIDTAHSQMTMNTLGDTTSFYTMPVVFSNTPDPQIEISPVISAAITGDTNNWRVNFTVGGQDVTSNILVNSGLNCVGMKRITNLNNLILNVHFKTLKRSAQPITINFTIMSNLGNTGNTSSYSIIAQTK